jgi:hypothetical protein
MKIISKFLTWLCLLCFVTITLQAQEVVSSSGGYGTAAGTKVTWTIGEPVTETVSTTTILTQGFNQGNLTIITTSKADIPGLSLKAYPNPASDNLILRVGGIDLKDLKYFLIDMNGKVLIENTFTGIETDISIGSLSPSTYFLKVYQNKTELIIFKIIKK